MNTDDISVAAANGDPADPAELLLPWYVSGNISDADRATVDLWLQSAPGAQAHLDRAIEELGLTHAASEMLGVPSRANLDRLMARVGKGAARTGAARTGAAETGGGWAERLWGYFSPRYALAGVAALCLLVVGQGIALTVLSQRAAPSTYATASTQTPQAAGPAALVAFVPGTSLEAISSSFEELGLHIADGPKPGGIYLVAAPDTADGRKALDALAANKLLVRFFSRQ